MIVSALQVPVPNSCAYSLKCIIPYPVNCVDIKFYIVLFAKSFSTHHQHSMNPAVQSVSISYNKARAVVGTRGGDILELKLQDGSLLKNRPITSGHYFGELWGLAAHPNDNNLFATSGDDKVGNSLLAFPMIFKPILRPLISNFPNARAFTSSCSFSPP